MRLWEPNLETRIFLSLTQSLSRNSLYPMKINLVDLPIRRRRTQKDPTLGLPGWIVHDIALTSVRSSRKPPQRRKILPIARAVIQHPRGTM